MWQTLAGVKQSFNFEPTDSVLQIKQTLQEKEGIDVAMIRLIYGGKQLSDEQTIANYNMKAGDTIHMILQLKGGNWTPSLIFTIHKCLANASSGLQTGCRFLWAQHHVNFWANPHPQCRKWLPLMHLTK